jgi:hypothetical protein
MDFVEKTADYGDVLRNIAPWTGITDGCSANECRCAATRTHLITDSVYASRGAKGAVAAEVAA